MLVIIDEPSDIMENEVIGDGRKPLTHKKQGARLRSTLHHHLWLGILNKGTQAPVGCGARQEPIYFR